MVTVVVIQRLSLFGWSEDDVAKQSFVIIVRSQCAAGGGNVGGGNPGQIPSNYRVHD
jgi:hypothetical protein